MKVIIIEDEETAARRLSKMVQSIDKSVDVVAILDSVDASIEWISENKGEDIDLAFLDIQLADGNSFEIFEHVDFPCPVVFTTAYDEFALQAFKVNAIDYLLKPIKKDELKITLEKFISKQEKQPGLDKIVQLLHPTEYKTRFVIRLGRQIKLIRTSDIAYFFTESKLTYLHTFAGKKYPIDISLEKLIDLLDPTVFFRANRQFILNIDSIQDMYTYSKSRVKINTNPVSPHEIVVSTERSSRFKKWLAGV